MTPQEPYWNDSDTSLWRKACYNFYLIALANGFAESLEPNALDNQIQSMRKSTTYTAFSASN